MIVNKKNPKSNPKPFSPWLKKKETTKTNQPKESLKTKRSLQPTRLDGALQADLDEVPCPGNPLTPTPLEPDNL